MPREAALVRAVNVTDLVDSYWGAGPER